jgi:type IV pilus assembly protein PilE
MRAINKSKGVTLIELMIVVAIIGIIASIALPSYREQVASSKRSDGTAALLQLASALERHYTENSTYCDAAGTGGANSCGGGANDTGPPTILGSTTVPLDGGTAYYNLTISAVTATTYTITATRTGSMSNDRCGNLTLTHAGQKGASLGTVNDCWH